jgi:hypothetical protein
LQGDTLSELAGPTLTIADQRLLLWRPVDARIPAEIAQLETDAGTTQPAAVDYAIERSGFRNFFPGFSGGGGTPSSESRCGPAILPPCDPLFGSPLTADAR